jgi:hypothetical protein
MTRMRRALWSGAQFEKDLVSAQREKKTFCKEIQFPEEARFSSCRAALATRCAPSGGRNSTSHEIASTQGRIGIRSNPAATLSRRRLFENCLDILFAFGAGDGIDVEAGF